MIRNGKAHEPKRHPHCLKHALGVALVGANVNLAVIKQALGHKSIASTAIYTVPTDETAGKGHPGRVGVHVLGRRAFHSI